MRLFWLCAFWLVLAGPLPASAWTEEEIETLSKSQAKNPSENLSEKQAKKQWRGRLSLYLSRNMELPSQYNDLDSLFSPKKEAALLDLSNLFFYTGLRLDYELPESLGLFRGAKLFAASSFSSPFAGAKNRLKRYGFGDLSAGLSRPLFARKSLLAELGLSLTLPLSRASRKASLWTSLEGSAGALYFLKRKKDLSLIASSSHSLRRHLHKYETANAAGSVYNIVYDTSHGGSLLLIQNRKKALPSRSSLGFSYYYGENYAGTRLHIASLSASLSYKLTKGLSLEASLKWRRRLFKKYEFFRFFDGKSGFLSAGAGYVF